MAITGNSSYDGWYFVIHGTNHLWEKYLKTHNKEWGSGHWLKRHRTGGTGGLFKVNNCLTEIQCAAFKIADATGMTIHADIDYEHLWTYSNVPPVMKVTLSIPGDNTHDGDIVIEGLNNTFVPRAKKKKELERALGKCGQ